MLTLCNDRGWNSINGSLLHMLEVVPVEALI